MGKRGWSVVLAVTAGLVTLFAAPYARTDWDYFWLGGDLLREYGTGAYGHLPGLLIGPIPLLYALAAPLWLELATPAIAAGVTVWLVARRNPWWALALTPALLAAPLWGHLDDVAAGWCALAALAGQRGLWVGIGAGCKPWLLPLAFLGPPRETVIAFAVAGGIWAPFVGSFPDLATSHVDPQPGSPWGVLGFMPPGIRLWQLVAMSAVVLWLRHDPARAVFAALTVRVLLEPGDWTYYATPLAMLAPRVVPAVTVPAVLLVWAVPQFGGPGWVRVVALLVLLAASHEAVARRAVRVFDAAVNRAPARIHRVRGDAPEVSRKL